MKIKVKKLYVFLARWDECLRVDVGHKVTWAHQPRLQKTFLASLFGGRTCTGNGSIRRSKQLLQDLPTDGWLITHTRERTMNSLVVTLESSFVFPDALKVERNHHPWNR